MEHFRHTQIYRFQVSNEEDVFHQNVLAWKTIIAGLISVRPICLNVVTSNELSHINLSVVNEYRRYSVNTRNNEEHEIH